MGVSSFHSRVHSDPNRSIHRKPCSRSQNIEKKTSVTLKLRRSYLKGFRRFSLFLSFDEFAHVSGEVEGVSLSLDLLL